MRNSGRDVYDVFQECLRLKKLLIKKKNKIRKEYPKYPIWIPKFSEEDSYQSICQTRADIKAELLKNEKLGYK